MSTSFYAKAIIGVKIDKKHCVEVKSVRNCGCHTIVTDEMKFCPECGNHAWRTEINLKDQLDHEVYHGFKIIVSYNYDDEINHIFIVGAGAETGDFCCGKDRETMHVLPTDINSIKNSLKETLETDGYWDESKFGLWAIGDIC